MNKQNKYEGTTEGCLFFSEKKEGEPLWQKVNIKNGLSQKACLK